MATHQPGSRLTYEYLRTHPEDAARVLEKLSVDAVAELMAKLPARLAAPVMGAMLPYAAGRCLARLPEATAGALINQSRATRASAMLRPLSEAQVNAIFAHVSQTHAARIRRLRSFPDDTVGAWVDSDVAALSAQHTVAEAHEQLRAHADLHLHQLYIVDERRRLLGVTSLGALLRAEPERSLAALSRPTPHTVSSRMSLQAARRHRGWANLCALPVVDPNGEFVGELRLGALQYVRRHGQAPDYETILPALETLTGGFCATVSEFIRLLFSGWNPSPGRRRHGD